MLLILISSVGYLALSLNVHVDLLCQVDVATGQHEVVLRRGCVSFLQERL